MPLHIVGYCLSFLLGSIPTGFLLAKLKGIDVRQSGSKNTGATNVARVAGKTFGILTLILDMSKGIAGACLALLLNPEADLGILALHGFAAILGHCYSPFLKFRGGKGVATSLGVFLIVSPLATLCALLVFALVFRISRFVSLASICAASMHPIAFWLLHGSGEQRTALAVSLLTALMIILRHQHNIRRLMRGEELRFGSQRGQGASSSNSATSA